MVEVTLRVRFRSVEGEAAPLDDLGVAGYEGASEIARGAQAVVFRALEHEHDRWVAVKVLAAPVLDDEARDRWKRECRAMGTLSGHPNIVTLFGSGFTRSGQPYLAMEYMAGGSLALRLAQLGRLPWQEAAAIGVKVAAALDLAHRARLVHGDLKPDNILVSAFEEPKLGDFGVAHARGAEGVTKLTATVAHAAPEILRGEAPDVRTDVYGLASTIFALIWGSAPFARSDDVSLSPMIQRIHTEPPPNLRLLDVPDPVCRVLEGALSKDPSLRHSTAADFGRDLQSAQRLAGLTPTEMKLAAPPPGQPDTLGPKESARPPRRAALWVAVGAAGLVLGVAGALVAANRTPPTTRPETRPPATARRPPTADDLRAALIGAADLPPGWSLDPAGTSVLFGEVSDLCGIPPRPGPLVQQAVRFRDAAGVVAVHVVASFAPDGAAQFMDSLYAAGRSCEDWEEETPQGTLLLNSFVDAGDAPSLGDESLVVGVISKDTTTGVEVEIRVIYVRAGSALAAVGIYSPTTVDSGLLDSLAFVAAEQLSNLP